MDTSEDPDTEEALKGFDFLSSPDEMDTSPESRGNGDGTDWGKSSERCKAGIREEVPSKHYRQSLNACFLKMFDLSCKIMSLFTSYNYTTVNSS